MVAQYSSARIARSRAEPHSGPLQAAREDFAALHRGQHPVRLDGSLFPGLPDRDLDLRELRTRLLDPCCSAATRDAVWAHVVVRARAEGAVFTAVCVGLALPTLARLARRLSHRFAADPSDLHAAVLTGFIAELAMIDVGSPNILVRLRWAAYRAGRAAVRDALDAPPPVPERSGLGQAREPSGHPDVVLTHAVAEGVLTDREAGLISATRLGDQALTEIARQLGVAYKTLHQTRRRAEARLAAWLREETGTGSASRSHTVTQRGAASRRHQSRGLGVENSPNTRSSSLRGAAVDTPPPRR